jgi:hypothetical protein
MGTRLYLYNVNAEVTPSSWLSGWHKTTGLTRKAETEKRNTNFAASLANRTGLSGTAFVVFNRWVAPALQAQTIGGTLKGVFNAKQFLDIDATLAIGVKVIKPDGTDRGTLLSVTASENVSTAPPELDLEYSTRFLRNASGDTDLPLTSVAVQRGDRLVIELGYRSAVEVDSAAGVLYGDQHDDWDYEEGLTHPLGYGTPWVEFSQTLAFVPMESAACGAALTHSGAVGIAPRTGEAVAAALGFASYALAANLAGFSCARGVTSAAAGLGIGAALSGSTPGAALAHGEIAGAVSITGTGASCAVARLSEPPLTEFLYGSSFGVGVAHGTPSGTLGGPATACGSGFGEGAVSMASPMVAAAVSASAAASTYSLAAHMAGTGMGVAVAGPAVACPGAPIAGWAKGLAAAQVMAGLGADMAAASVSVSAEVANLIGVRQGAGTIVAGAFAGGGASTGVTIDGIAVAGSQAWTATMATLALRGEAASPSVANGVASGIALAVGSGSGASLESALILGALRASGTVSVSAVAAGAGIPVGALSGQAVATSAEAGSATSLAHLSGAATGVATTVFAYEQRNGYLVVALAAYNPGVVLTTYRM